MATKLNSECSIGSNLIELWRVAGSLIGQESRPIGLAQAVVMYWGIIQDDLEQLSTQRSHAKKGKSKKSTF